MNLNPRLASMSTNRLAVKMLPWSLLTTPGVPYFSNALPNAPTTGSVSRVSASSQPTIMRVARIAIASMSLAAW